MVKKVIITSHVVYVGKRDVFGPGHALSNYLENKKIPHVYLRHSLLDVRPSEILLYSKKRLIKRFLKLPIFRIGLLRYPIEMWYSFRFYREHRPDICIAIDPVNAFSALIAKKSGSIKTVIFYSADYAINRFKNKFLNYIYHALDRYAINNADLIWNVSSRIQKIRERQNVPNTRNILIPNSPLVKTFNQFRATTRKSQSMVLMANFTPAIDYSMIVSVVKELKYKYKNIHMGFIGTGELEEQVRKKVNKLKLSANFTFHGFMPHQKAISTAALYQVGLAPYANLQSWTKFGDSLKAREYMALGLPVIISKNVSTSDDIKRYNAGITINMKKKELKKAIVAIFGDRKYYLFLQKNALRLAREHDLERILNSEFKQRFAL